LVNKVRKSDTLVLLSAIVKNTVLHDLKNINTFDFADMFFVKRAYSNTTLSELNISILNPIYNIVEAAFYTRGLLLKC